MEHRPLWKTEKTASLVHALVAEFLVRESGGQSLITVTDIEVSPDRRRARVYLSVLPETMETRAVEFANRQKREVKEYVRTHSRMRAVPSLEFVLDQGEKNRQRIDELLHEDERETKSR